MIRSSGVALLCVVATGTGLSAQGYRLRLDTGVQSVSWRGLQADSVPVAEAVAQPGGGFVTGDGYAATCDDTWCHFFRAGAVLRGVPLVSQADLTMWGFGVRALSLRANARYASDLGASAQWPGSEPTLQLVEGYLEFIQNRFTIQAGRQLLPGRLGMYGLDGARVGWRSGATGLEAAAYGGWGLARGTALPVTSPAVNPLDDFQPRDRQLVAGLDVGWSSAHTDVRAEYRREVDPAVDYYVSERVSGSLALRPVQRVTVTAGAAYDLAFGQWGSADAAVTWIARPATLSVGARRYLPFFDLWTIWGAFSPVAFHAWHGSVTASPVAGLVLQARGERYVFDESGASAPLVSVEDRGWRIEAGASWRPTAEWTVAARHETEFGPGASSRGFDAQVTWHPVEPLTFGVHAATLRRPLELRFSDATLAIYGADAEWRAGTRWKVGLHLTRVDERRDRPDASAMDWDQLRVAARVTLLRGSDVDRPRLPPAIRTGGAP